MKVLVDRKQTRDVLLDADGEPVVSVLVTLAELEWLARGQVSDQLMDRAAQALAFARESWLGRSGVVR